MSATITRDSNFEFHEKTISQLVYELNNLGQSNVTMQPTLLIGIIDRQSELVRRFRSKSIAKSCSESRANDVRDSRQSYGTTCREGMKQFFLTEGSQKKYYYNEICNELEVVQMGKIMAMWDQGFNTNILLQGNFPRFSELLRKVQPWIEGSQNDPTFYASFIEYQPKQAVDLLSSSLNKAIPLVDAPEAKLEYQQTTVSSIISKFPKQTPNLKILRIIKKRFQKLSTQSQHEPELRIIILPPQFLSITSPSCHPSLRLTKSQLTQILTYIRTHPNKKYQNINKLLPKRYAVTTVLAEMILYDSVNVVVNWVADGETGVVERGKQREGQDLINGKLEFFGKIAGLSNMVKRVLQPIKRNIIIRARKSEQKSGKSQGKGNWMKNSNFSKKMDKKQTNENESPKSELEYCRSLERKTHKYSLPEPEPLFPETLPIYPPIPKQLNQSQAISLLKSRHAEQIYQYHQTIQNLNKKILVLTEERGITQLYAIHEKEIMMLQLKIEQLRGDIGRLCQKQTQQTEIKNLREMVKKLNEEILREKRHGTSVKVSQGKIKMLEKQVSEWKQKHSKSQIARKQLKLQLDSCVKRLNLHSETHQPERACLAASECLSAKQIETLGQLSELSKDGQWNQKSPYIIQKCKTILWTVSQLRQRVLKCHNFLVELQDWVEERFGEKEPQLVLECNRFIRTYLMDNLDIF